jgi:hypothetical protein
MREAADELGVSVEAIRKRVQRGSIRSDKDPDGRRYVYLDAGRDPQAPVELVDVLRAQVEDLRADRDAWREQARRSDYLLGSSMERTRELEGRLRELEAGPDAPRASSSEATESPESPGPTATPTEAGDGPETAAQRRPWWRRMFGR